MSKTDEELRQEVCKEAELFVQAVEEFIVAVIENHAWRHDGKEDSLDMSEIREKRRAFVDALLKTM